MFIYAVWGGALENNAGKSTPPPPAKTQDFEDPRRTWETRPQPRKAIVLPESCLRQALLDKNASSQEKKRHLRSCQTLEKGAFCGNHTPRPSTKKRLGKPSPTSNGDRSAQKLFEPNAPFLALRQCRVRATLKKLKQSTAA